MSAKSTRRSSSGKSATDRPPKPYPDFPLGAAPNGCWQKRIKGELWYFGRWGRTVKGVMTRIQEDGCWELALRLYKAQIDEIILGREPRARIVNGEVIADPKDGLTLGTLRDKFLTAKSSSVDAGELTMGSYKLYKATTVRLITKWGENRRVDDLTPEDFESLRADITRGLGVVARGNEIQRTKTFFKYAYDLKLVDRPVDFGPNFKKPSKAQLRKLRNERGERMFSQAQIIALLDGAIIKDDEGEEKVIPPASAPLRAMILLGINCAYGNGDVGQLPLSKIDLDGGWATYARPKTHVKRRAALWPETVAALRNAIAERPKPASEEFAGLVFITVFGSPWCKSGASDAVTQEFGKRLLALGLTEKGRGFYALRHTFRTVADATLDFVAVRHVMGHADDSIDDTYRESIGDDRLRKVSDCVRAWLFGEQADDTTEKSARPKRKPATKSKAKSSADPDGPSLKLYAG